MPILTNLGMHDLLDIRASKVVQIGVLGPFGAPQGDKKQVKLGQTLKKLLREGHLLSFTN